MSYYGQKNRDPNKVRGPWDGTGALIQDQNAGLPTHRNSLTCLLDES